MCSISRRHVNVTRSALLAALVFAAAGGACDGGPPGTASEPALVAEAPPAPPPVAGAEGPVARVILLGIDGLAWRVLQPLVDAGRVPNFARFLARGASGELVTMLPTYSPILWATIATGRTAGEHGIRGFASRSRDAPDRIVPFTSNARRTRAIWNILSDAGRRVAVVGWWTTWPAEPVAGVMVSDRMLYNRFNLLLGDSASGGDLPHQTWPEELFAELAPLAIIDERSAADVLDRFAPERPDRTLHKALHDPYYELFLVHARDTAYLKMLADVREREPYDFIAFYVNGVDIASHYFWKYAFPEQWKEPVDPALVRANGEVIDRYLIDLDAALGTLLGEADANTVVIVVSDHGFVTGERPDTPNVSGIHYDRAPPGVIAMAGGAVRPGTKIGGASIFDVTPTILHLFGLPIARDMSGTVLSAAVGGDANLAARPIAHIASYETATRDAAASVVTDYDDAIIGRLERLGYLDDPSAVPDAEDAAGDAVQKTVRDTVRGEAPGPRSEEPGNGGQGP